MLFLVTAAGRQASAELLVTGTGRDRELVKEQFPRPQRDRYELVVARCTKCHRMSRVIDALSTGITPVTRSKFDEKAIPQYVIKMLRKGKSGIGKNDAKNIIDFLLVARRLAQVPPVARKVAPPRVTPAPSASPSPSPQLSDAGARPAPTAPDGGAAGEGTP